MPTKKITKLQALIDASEYKTHEEVAKAIGSSRSYISALASGSRPVAKSMAQKLAPLLKVRWMDLMDTGENEEDLALREAETEANEALRMISELKVKPLSTMAVRGEVRHGTWVPDIDGVRPDIGTEAKTPYEQYPESAQYIIRVYDSPNSSPSICHCLDLKTATQYNIELRPGIKVHVERLRKVDDLGEYSSAIATIESTAKGNISVATKNPYWEPILRADQKTVVIRGIVIDELKRYI